MLDDYKLKEAIQELKASANGFSDAGISERFERIEEDYQMMLDYMRRGYKDTKRDEMYKALVSKLYVLSLDIEQAELFREKSIYSEAYDKVKRVGWDNELIRFTLENFVSDIAMLQLEPNDVRLEKQRALYKRHQEFMSTLFRKIWLSFQWNENEADFYEQLLTSPTVDSRDAQLMVSALTLAAMRQFDILKLRTLMHVYKQSADMQVQQRALVGVAFSIDSDADPSGKQKELLMSFLDDEQVCRELVGMQMQVIYCLKSSDDYQEITDDLIPTIMKNSNLRITRFGIEEKEDDPMEDILDPGAVDRAMEEMERIVDRISAMSREGADIYFGGFKMMKNYPFFNDVANWLMPFFMEHPALNRPIDKVGGVGILRNIIDQGSLCNSDKYSLAMASASVFRRLPPPIREIMTKPFVVNPMEPENSMEKAALIRRMYLQDLYRFFTLFPQRDDLDDPYDFRKDIRDGSLRCFFFEQPLLADSPLNHYKVELGRFLLKHKRMIELGMLLRNMTMKDPDEETDEEIDEEFQQEYISYGKLQIAFLDYINNTELSIILCKNLLEMEPDNIKVMRTLARLLFNSGQFGNAAEYYEQLMKLQPDNRNHELNYCSAMLKTGIADERVMNLIYKLDYDAPDDLNVQRVKAWAMMMKGNTQQARTVYEKLTASKDRVPEDYLNAGYCEWIDRNVEKTIFYFTEYRRMLDDDDYDIGDNFSDDADLLISHGVTEAEMAMMRDLL